jgi:carboxypeptidase PM20D1
MKKILLAILGVVLILVAVIVIKTLTFKSNQPSIAAVDTIKVDENAVIARLSQALKIQTLSHQDAAKFKPEPFLQFHRMLEKSFPAVHQTLSLQLINEYSLLYKWVGSEPSLKPVVLLAHMDVVPVEPGTEKNWKHGAFSGDIADSYIWGRGTLDMKGVLMGLMEATEALVKSGFNPKRTLYLAFGHDEELGGPEGAGEIVEHLKQQGIQIAFTLDEGMMILDSKISPTKKELAVIGLAEKGYVTLELTAKGKGGHSSMPPSKTTVGSLSRAIVALEDNQMPPSLSGAAGYFFDTIARDMPFVQKMMFANLWLFEGLLLDQLVKNNVTSAMVRTTTAPTIIKGGVKSNVLPSQAQALVNFRIIPGNKVEDVVEHAKSAINDPGVEVNIYQGRGTSPSPVARTDSESFNIIRRTVHEVFPGIASTPGLVIAGTDTKHYVQISDNNYRFAPMLVGTEDVAGIHGTNERIKIERYVKMIPYYARLMENAASAGGEI